MRCRSMRERRSSWIATTISSPLSRHAEPLCEALIPRIQGWSFTGIVFSMECGALAPLWPKRCPGGALQREEVKRYQSAGEVVSKAAGRPSVLLLSSCRAASEGFLYLPGKTDKLLYQAA